MLSKFNLLAATAAISALGAGSVQAQTTFPAATIVGAGASLPQNVARQAGDCYGAKTLLGFGVSSNANPAANPPVANSNFGAAGLALTDFDYNTPAADTLANRFSCAGDTANTPIVSPNFGAPRIVQPAISTRYLSTGSGQGVTAFLNNRVSSTIINDAGGTVPSYIDADGYQYSFSETALSAANLTTYNGASINPFIRYTLATGTAASPGVTGTLGYDSVSGNPIPLTAANLFGPAIQVPIVLAAVAVGYSPVYARVRAADGSITEYRFALNPLHVRADGSGGLRLTKAQYCAIFNGQITNWNQLPTTIVNKDPADTAAFNVPIRLAGRSETSGTSSLFTRAMAAQCNGQVIAIGNAAPVPVVNRFIQSENRLPYSGTPTIAGTAYTGAATLSSTNSLSGALFNRVTSTFTGTEAVGLFSVASGNDGVAALTAFAPDPGPNAGDRTLNGRVAYVSPEQTLPASTVNGTNTFGLNTASLQVGTGTTFVGPDAKDAAAAFAGVQPPQSRGTAGAYCVTGNPVACTTGGDRSDPLAWVQAADRAALLANPAKGYPIVGTSNALLYTCYATPARRQAIAGYFDFLLGRVTKDFNNQGGPTNVVVDAVNGVFARSGLAPMPAAWRTAMFETFFRNSIQVGNTASPSTTTLGGRNLWIQNAVPTTPANTATLTGNITVCAGKPGA